MIVREEELHDRPAVHDVVRAAFGRPAEAVLVDRLRADGDSVVSLVALDHARVIGQVHALKKILKSPRLPWLKNAE
jgi:putative acetyltransferase